ncbi:Predicted oxidoreductase [Paenibacillus sp. 1_12]|uniref:aldo/keto reductase n=1 Tax=Paenibacillus sp. 1_12 TaxID=1566278 RepID=UPI0008EC8240|nr:aldo/keto reductase [Paenibacillus sp. 1_12]SFK95624.1 Predicted oxidoreductase [Paenibacillus sp. 1_12]
MKYGYLGRTGLKVSKLCLGTGTFGAGSKSEGNWGCVEEKEAFKIMDAALDAGINFFDTANVYGRHGEGGYCGLTEEIIGRWFAQGGGRREKVVIATKVEREMEGDELDGPNKARGLSLYKIRRHIEGSLRRLQTDHVELYQMHNVDRKVTWDELWEAFEGLVRQGKVDYIGSSNYAAWDLMKAQEAARKRNFMGLVNEQHRYNLFCRIPELEVLPAAMDQGIGITIWSPLVRGLLGVNMFELDRRHLSDEVKMVIEKYRPQLTAFSQLCRDLNETEASVALAWELNNPAIVAPVIGPSSLQDLNEMLRAVEIKLDESTLKRLDEIFPGPGGTAPTAYDGWKEFSGGGK